jgi:nucleoid DNA-binding protein
LNIGQLSMTLTKRDLVVCISEETGLNQSQVFDVMQNILDHVTKSLASGGNPNRPETDVPIPARAMVKFKGVKEMKASVLKLTPMSVKKAP